MAANVIEDPELLCEVLQPAPQQNSELATKALVGKMRANKVLNAKAVKDIIVNAWAAYPGVQITELGKNLFLFNFATEEHKKEVMRRAHWFIMNQLLCLESWLPHVSYEQIEFNQSPMWIQVQNHPLELLSVANARKLLQKVGEVTEIEDPIVKGNLLRTFIRGKVVIHLDKLIPTGCWAPRSNLPNLSIVYKYERLQSLCYKCGIIGHDQNSCSKPTVMSPFDPTKPKFGPDLSVSMPLNLFIS